MKDNFSRQSDAYAKFRPVYTSELYQIIFQQISVFGRVWDCGTGNGQVAAELAGQFEEVQATDISQKQLDKAVKKENIHYSLQAAETASFQENYFDLITVGQAIHWFDHDRFYEKVRSCLKPQGVLAVFGYQLFRMSEGLNQVIDRFYYDIVGPYWDPERRHIDNAYANIPFPFQLIPTSALQMEYDWTFDQTLGYLSSWSSVQHFKQKEGRDPVDLIRNDLENAWGDVAKQTATFNILLRLGKNA